MSNVFGDIDPNELNWGTEAKQAAIGGLQADPERSAEAMRLSKTTGAPAVAIEQDPEPFKLQTRTQALGQIFSDNLEMQKYATSNPQAPKVSNDDWDKLDIFSRWMKTLKTSIPAALQQSAIENDPTAEPNEAAAQYQRDLAEDVPGQFKAGGLQYERGALGTGIAARNELGFQIEPTIEDRLNEIEKNLKGAGSAKTIFGEVANMVGTMLPSAGPTFAGAAVGSVVGTPGFGTGAGAVTAFGVDQGRIAAGNSYLDGMKQGLDPNANLLKSAAVGVVTGVLNAVGGAEGGKPLVAGIQRVVEDGVAKITSNATWTSMFSRAAQSIAKQGMLGAAIMGAQTYADEIFTGLAKEFTAAKSGKEWATIFNDPEERARMTDVVTDAMMQGAEFFALMHIPAIGINMHVDAMHIAQSKTNAKMLDGILRARDETATYTRSPELIDEFVKQHELNAFGVDPAKAMEIYKAQPQAFSFVPDFERKAAEAQQSGGLLELNANDYIANVGPELHGQIKDDLSINNGLTVNEARLLEEMPPRYTSVFHGSPYLFDRFDLSKVGTGDGAQAYGYGHYFTEDQGIAEGYRDRLSEDKAGDRTFLVNGEELNISTHGDLANAIYAVADTGYFDGAFGKWNLEDLKKTLIEDMETRERWEPEGSTKEEMKARDDELRKQIEDLKSFEIKNQNEVFPTLYRANITAHPDSFLHWDQPLKEQPTMQAALEKVAAKLEQDRTAGLVSLDDSTIKILRDGDAPGASIVHELEGTLGPELTRQYLHDAGINGVKYRAAGHRRVNANGKLETLTVNGEKYDINKDGHFDAKEMHENGGPDGYIEQLRKVAKRNREDIEGQKQNTEELRKASDADIEEMQRQRGDYYRGDPVTAREEMIKESEKWEKEYADRADKLEAKAAEVEKMKEEGTLPKVEVTEEDPLHNFVVFNDDHIQITHRNDEPYPPEPPPEVAASPKATEAYWSTATDLDVVAKAEARAAGLNGLFADAKAAGMTKAEYALYQRKLADAQKAQDDKVFKAAAKEAKKRLSAEWEKNEERVRGEVTPEVALEPEFMAIRAMVDGKDPNGEEIPKIRLDPEAVKQMLGDYAGNRADYPDTLPKGLTEKGGIHPDDAATIFGFDSGQEMLAKLGAAEADRLERGETWNQRFNRAVDEETSRRMEAQYGKLEENIVAEAREAALNSAQINVLSAELEHLAKLSGIETPFTQAELRASAAEIFERRIVGKESKPDQWVKNAGRMARQAEMMLLRGKYAEAYMAKQRQMLALNIAREAQAFATQKKNFDKIIQPFLKNEALAKVDQGYTDQIQRVLNQVLQYPTRRDMAELIRGNDKSLTDFVEEKLTANRQIDPPEYLFDQQFLAQQDRRPETLTVGEFRDLRQFMKQMIFHGKDEKEATVNGQKVVMEQVRRDAVASAEKLQQAWNKNPKTVLGKIGTGLRAYDAAYIKADRLLSWLGGRDPNSPWMQMVIRPIQAAKHMAADLAKSLAKEFKNIEAIKGLHDDVSDSPFRNSQGDAIRSDRETLIMAMLNVGNDGNLKVLARGYHTTPDEVMNWIHNNARAEDWRWVQKIWDIMEEKLFPLQDKAARENTGVGIKKVEAREIETAHGTFRGGYFPLMEDFNSIDRKVKGDPFENANGFPPVPTANWTKRRTGAAYPLALDMARLPAKLNDIIHYVSYAKAWKDAHNFLNDPAMRKSIDGAFGLEYRKNLQAWMNNIATNGGKVESTGLEGIAKGARFLRENAVGVLVGLRPSTMLIHDVVAAANSMVEVGPIKFSKAFARTAVDAIFRSPENYGAAARFAYENSGELRNRKNYIDRDIATGMRQSLTDGTMMRARAWYLNFMGSLLAHFDQASAIPTWHAAYQAHMEKFSKIYPEDDAHGRAVFAADQAVRNAHGANGLPDLPAIMRGNGAAGELAKFFTMFGGFFNHFYNQLRDGERAGVESIHDIKAGNFSEAKVHGGIALGALMGYVLAGSMWHHAVRPNPDDRSGWGHWMAESVAEQLAATQFGIRDAAFWWKTGHRGSVAVASPLGEILTGLFAPLADADQYAKNKMPEKWVSHMLTAPMYATGFGAPNYIADWMQYLVNSANGRARKPGTWAEWQRLLLDAKAPQKRKRH